MLLQGFDNLSLSFYYSTNNTAKCKLASVVDSSHRRHFDALCLRLRSDALSSSSPPCLAPLSFADMSRARTRLLVEE